ncbi:hypothetical protein [Sphingobacterium sp. LRF_L2]
MRHRLRWLPFGHMEGIALYGIDIEGQMGNAISSMKWDSRK